MDDSPILIISFMIILLAIVGVAHLVTDNRNFYEIEKECASIGYIQNEHTRIFCNVEEKVKK